MSGFASAPNAYILAKGEGEALRSAFRGAPGWRSRLSVRLQPGHDLAVREFGPRVRLWADGSEPGACFRFCVSLSLCPSPVHALSLSVPKINKKKKKIEKKKKTNQYSNYQRAEALHHQFWALVNSKW